MIKALGPAFGNDSEDGQDDEDKFMRAAPPPARTIPTVSVFVPHILFVPHRASSFQNEYLHPISFRFAHSMHSFLT